jgi:hypothetical protein
MRSAKQHQKEKEAAKLGISLLAMNTEDLHTAMEKDMARMTESLKALQKKDSELKLRVFSCTGFTGYYPANSAAIVMAMDSEDAAAILNQELLSIGLLGNADPRSMIPFPDENDRSVRILNDGNY